MIAKRVRITGRVQGVFFRAWTKEQAERLGIDGWVRNCADGSVEAQVEGDATAVEQIVAQMRAGPSGARVDQLSLCDAALEGNDGFSVQH